MPTPQIPKVSSDASLEQLRDSIIGMNRYLTYLLSTLDTLNIKRLDAEVIIAQSITAGKLAADSVQTENLQAGAVTAEKITVAELSAISADLGKITAGEIYGAYIASREADYPRAELKSSGDVFAAFYNALNYIAVESDYSGVPSLNFIHDGNVIGRIDTLPSILELIGLNGLILSAPGGTLELNASDIMVTTSGLSRYQNFYKIYDSSTAESLQEKLDNIDSTISSLFSLYSSLDSRVTALENP